MEKQTVLGGLIVYVNDHAKMIKYYEEMGFYILDQFSEGIFCMTHMKFTGKGDLVVAIVGNPELDDQVSMTMSMFSINESGTSKHKEYQLCGTNYERLDSESEIQASTVNNSYSV